MTYYIFTTGGVFSSIGKGLTTAAIASLLEARGLKIAMMKLDPYLNVDPGTMNPFQHGEVYVTDDGAETDLDLGHYYRFTNSYLNKNTNATSGQIYETVIKNERRGDYLGNTVQVNPHITDEIKRRIHLAAAHDPRGVDILFVEIGGTVGDIESLPFLEAIRQFKLEIPKHCLNIHMTFVPFLDCAAELKTKPTQHSVQTLRSIGIIPDLIVCRSQNSLPKEIREKIALFCGVSKNCVVDAPDAPLSIYEIPSLLKKTKIDTLVCELLGINVRDSQICFWDELVEKIHHPKKHVVIGVVGKYVQHKDAYKSVVEALYHASYSADSSIEIRTFDPEQLSPSFFKTKEFSECQGILVPGGFGKRGWDGKLLVARYCREHKIPYFGICLGMQVLAVEFARGVLGLMDADSTEMNDQTKNPVISLLSEQQKISDLGGTMRLGSSPSILIKDSKIYKAYGKKEIFERHRHRYEFNNSYIHSFEEHGALISAVYEEKALCEAIEIKDHPWMIGVQFHPEFKSKPLSAHPLFIDFIHHSLSKRT